MCCVIPLSIVPFACKISPLLRLVLKKLLPRVDAVSILAAICLNGLLVARFAGITGYLSTTLKFYLIVPMASSVSAWSPLRSVLPACGSVVVLRACSPTCENNQHKKEVQL